MNSTDRELNPGPPRCEAPPILDHLHNYFDLISFFCFHKVIYVFVSILNHECLSWNTDMVHHLCSLYVDGDLRHN